MELGPASVLGVGTRLFRFDEDLEVRGGFIASFSSGTVFSAAASVFINGTTGSSIFSLFSPPTLDFPEKGDALLIPPSLCAAAPRDEAAEDEPV